MYIDIPCFLFIFNSQGFNSNLCPSFASGLCCCNGIVSVMNESVCVSCLLVIGLVIQVIGDNCIKISTAFLILLLAPDVTTPEYVGTLNSLLLWE